MRAVEVVSWKWEQERIGCVVGSCGTDGGCGRWVVEVYKWFPNRTHWGLIAAQFFAWEF